MRHLAFPSLILVAGALGCASAGGAPPVRSDRIVSITETDLIKATDLTTPESVHVKASPDSVYSLLRSIYPEIGVDVKLFDPANHLIGNRNFSKYHNLKGVPLHEFVSCGSGLTGPSADTYRVSFSLVTYVAPDAGGTLIATVLEAKADDMGSSKGMIGCNSTGALESRVNKLVLSRTGG